MSGKPKFRPIITRVKLNPEQAVLACSCWLRAQPTTHVGTRRRASVCVASARTSASYSRTQASSARS